MKKLTFFLLLLMASAYAQAQHRLVGKVTDAENQEALIGATILIQGTTKGTTTDIEGNYILDVTEKGNYQIKFSYVGYPSIVKEVAVDGITELSISLEASANKLGVLDIYGNKTYPVTLTKVSQAELEAQNLGQDLPILLNFTPSVVTTSDAGAGVGYTGMRIRGSDPQRINVTVNGIPMNDAESHGVFWVNMPDFASSVQNITIQRGVGTSTNGAGAFGGSVNLTTEKASDTAFAEYNGSVGSFNTFKNNVEFGTGKINNKLSISGRLSKITSDGYIDNAWVDLKSFFITADYESKAGTFTANIFSGKEITFQAWNGVPEGEVLEGNRTFNELAGYDNEVDNYQQDHYQLLYNANINQYWTTNVALHYTKGRGYFEQFRGDDDLTDYTLPNVTIGDETISSSDLIRRRWLDNDFYGAVYSLNYRKDKIDWIIGGGWNKYQGKHFGEVIWARFMSTGNIRHRYYDNDATKTDFNIYTKATYEVVQGLNLFTDLQWRRINYDFLGFDNNGNNIGQTDELSFFNPKVGVRYSFGNHELYSSFAIGNKEPTRDDYTDTSVNSRPEHETLRNLELGYSGSLSPKVAIAANFYLMDYKNQLILKGAINDVGEYTRINVDKSYRMGVELQGKFSLSDRITWEANATFSRNKIRDFVDYLDSYDLDFNYLGEEAIFYGDTDIAFSPNVIVGSQLTFKPFDGASISLLSKYVGSQFLDNTSSADRQLDAYFTNDVRLTYQFSKGMLKNGAITLLINNIANTLYESNGYTYGWLYGDERGYENYYYPQAGTNFLLGLKLRF